MHALEFVDRCPELEESDSIQHLNLSISSYTAATPTLQALASSVHLKEAWLATEEGDQGVGLLCREVLQPNTSLQRLRLDFKECSDEGIKEVAQIMRSNKNLKQLSLLLNNVGEEGAGHISQALMDSPLEEFSIYATQLDLHDKCIGDAGVAALCKALEVNKNLTALCIAQCGVTGMGVTFLTNALASNSNITSLDLHANHIDEEGVEPLAHHLTSTNCALKRLILDGNHSLGSNGATSLAMSLCSNTSLQVLSVQSCGVGGKGAERFATTLSQNHTLQELRFRGNGEFGDNAVELLTRGLKVNRALQTLDLSSCGVGDEGCAHLAEALLHNQTLHTLLLHKNDITDGGIAALSETLSKQSYLTCLVLTENRFGAKGTAALLHALQHNTSLTTLTLDTPTVGGANTMSTVAGVLVAKNKQLQHYRKLAADLKKKNSELTTQLEKFKNQIAFS